MKHIVNYGLQENLLSNDMIKDKVNAKMLDYSSKNFDTLTPIKNNEYNLYKKFVELEEYYKIMLLYVRSNVNTDKLEVLAKEDYRINKSNYYQPEKRDFDYINIKYHDDKPNKKIKALKIHKELLNSNISIKQAQNKYPNSDNIEYILDIKDFAYDAKYKDFSKFVFEPTTIGVIKNILDAHDRFIIAEITQIKKEHYQSYDEVKDSILNKLKENKSTREFNKLLGELTMDPVEINKSNVVALKTRYLINNLK